MKKHIITKVLTLTIIAIMTILTIIPAFAQETAYPLNLIIKPGDANNDYIVNIIDATCIQKHISDLDSITKDKQLLSADFNGDGLIDITDATEIQKMLADIDYQSIVKPDNSYQNIRYEHDSEAEFTNPIDTKFLQREYDYFKGRKLDVTGWYLIKSADEYYDLFGYYRPYFDDNFFEENALIIYTIYFPGGEENFYDGRTILTVSRDGSTLYVEWTNYVPMACDNWFDPRDRNLSMYSQVKKEDIEGVNEIKVRCKTVHDNELWYHNCGFSTQFVS